MQKKIKEKKSISVIVLGVGLMLYSALLLLLLFWGVLTSLKTDDDFLIRQNYLSLPKDPDTGNLLWPWAWDWKNYTSATKFLKITGLYRNGRSMAVPFDTQVLYSVVYAGGCALVGALCPCIMAYATSKFAYKICRVIDSIVIIVMIVPIVGAQISLVSLLHSFGIYDTWIGIFLPKMSFTGMYYLMFSAIFKGVSKEYYEAATIDGASEWTLLVRIAFPLVINSFALIVLLLFIQYWNDYQTLLIYAPSHPTITYGLFRIMTDPTGSSERGSTGVQMASCVIIAMPVIILFIIFRNKLMGNLTIGGVKE